MDYHHQSLDALTLGRQTQYASQYDLTLLQGVPRQLNQDQLNITEKQPFTFGTDI